MGKLTLKNKIEGFIRAICWRGFIKFGHITEEQYFNYLEREIVDDFLIYTHGRLEEDVLVDQVNKEGQVASPEVVRSAVGIIKNEVPRLIAEFAFDYFKRDERPAEQPTDPKSTSLNDVGQEIKKPEVSNEPQNS